MKAIEIVNFLKENYHIHDEYDIAFIMGSGLDEGMPDFQNAVKINYEQTPMPKSKVEGFTGEFVFGQIGKLKVMKITRYHYYETGNLELVRLPFEILSQFKVKNVIMATSCISINSKFKLGDLLLIKDHINLTGNNPLINTDVIEFVYMGDAYDSNLRKIAMNSAIKNNYTLNECVHMQLSGPTYETPAEINMAKILGADTISMSTAYDVICARKYNIKVLAFAFISDAINAAKVSHENVLKMARSNSFKLKEILTLVLNELN